LVLEEKPLIISTVFRKPNIASFAVTLLLVMSFAATAQDATFTASVDPERVGAGEQFQLHLTFSGNSTTLPSGLKPPDFGKFVVISGPNTSQSIQFINMRASVQLVYSYVLYAREPGTYTIGPASVEYKGSTVKTEPVKVVVEKGKPSPKAGEQDAGAAQAVGDNIVLVATADRKRVRLGEQVTVTWKIYYRVATSLSRISKIPTFEGFWGEDFELPKQAEPPTETLNGKQYRAAILKKTALFPSQTGRLTVGPMELVAAVQLRSHNRSRDPFDQFFNDPFFQNVQTVELTFASEPIAITVDPLPAGAPEGFGNAVGRYSFSASVDKQEVKAGEAVTLRMAVKGTGNLKLLTLPKPVVPGDIEAFEPKVTEEISRDGGAVSGSKSAEIVLVPRNEGRRVIEPMRFSYYDPAKGSYVSLTSPRFELKVLPGRELAMSAEGFSKEDVRLLGQDIRFLKLEPGDLEPIDAAGRFGGDTWAALLIPPLAFIGAYVARRRMERIYGDLPTLRFERAGREASRRLQQAKKLLAQGNSEQYHAELLRALTSYFEHKLRLPKASLSSEEILSRLAANGVTEEVLAGVRECMERAEFARYAPGSDSRGARQDLLDAASRAIDAVEQTFKP
jgi:hypothetical protein